MAQAKREPKRKRTLEELLGTPEEQKAEREAVAKLLRRYRGYAGTIEETRAALDRDMGDRLLSDAILEARRQSR